MRKLSFMAIVFLLTSLLSATYATDDKSLVRSDDLRELLRDCSHAASEVRCLRVGILELIDDGDVSQLECRQGANGRFAVYDLDYFRFLDRFFMKSLRECQQSIREVNRGLFCSVGNNGNYAIQRVSDAQFIGQFYSIPFTQCLQALQGIRHNRVCIAGANGRFARYDFVRRVFVDPHFSMDINSCNGML